MRMNTIARRLYSDHTHLREGQQCNDEDEQTRKRSKFPKNCAYTLYIDHVHTLYMYVVC